MPNYDNPFTALEHLARSIHKDGTVPIPIRILLDEVHDISQSKSKDTEESTPGNPFAGEDGASGTSKLRIFTPGNPFVSTDTDDSRINDNKTHEKVSPDDGKPGEDTINRLPLGDMTQRISDLILPDKADLPKIEYSNSSPRHATYETVGGADMTKSRRITDGNPFKTGPTNFTRTLTVPEEVTTEDVIVDAKSYDGTITVTVEHADDTINLDIEKTFTVDGVIVAISSVTLDKSTITISGVSTTGSPDKPSGGQIPYTLN